MSGLFPLGVDLVEKDWRAHLWILDYCGEHLARLGSLPLVVHADMAAGIPWFGFYGQWFYLPLGLPCAVFDARIVIKGVVLVAAALQFWLVYRCLRQSGVGRFWAFVPSCLVAWSVYPLTALYNRGALPEWFANVELVCCLCLGLLSMDAHGNPARRSWLLLLAWFFLTLVFGTHPISALYAIPLFVWVLLVLCLMPRQTRLLGLRQQAGVQVLGLALFVLCSVAWLYLAFRYSGDLGFVDFRQSPPYDAQVDGFMNRFSLLPQDPRMAQEAAVLLPHLDLQANSLLLLLALGLSLAVVFRCPRQNLPWFLAGLSGLAFFVVLSCTPRGLDLLPPVFRAVQFRYRIINQINLYALFMLWVAFRQSRGLPQPPALGRLFAPVLGAGFLVAGFCVLGVKLSHGLQIRSNLRELGFPKPVLETGSYIKYQDFSYGFFDLGTPRLHALVGGVDLGRAVKGPFVALPVGSGSEIGTVGEGCFHISKTGWYPTNILAHPWNQLELDGRPVPVKEVQVMSTRVPHQALFLEEGPHRLRYAYKPDRLWLSLFQGGVVVLVCWALGLCLWPLASHIRRRRAAGEVLAKNP